jgi:hypothetical protein
MRWMGNLLTYIDRSRPKEGSRQVLFNLSDAPALEKNIFEIIPG